MWMMIFIFAERGRRTVLVP